MKNHVIERVKQGADKKAEISAAVCRARAPSAVIASMIPNNHRFFRRMAGLAGRDATERKE